MSEGCVEAVEWLGLMAASRLAGVSRATLHRAAVVGDIPYAVVAGRRFFAPADVLAWRHERVTAGPGRGRY